MRPRLVYWLQALLAIFIGGAPARSSAANKSSCAASTPLWMVRLSAAVGVTPFEPSAPTEKDKTSLPTYVIEPPDTLLIDAVKLVPKPPTRSKR